VNHLLGGAMHAYTSNQMSYDLGRLRLNGIIERLEGTNTYQLTAEGQRVAILYTEIHDRLLRPLLAADTPSAPLELRQALHTIDRHVHGYIDDARLGNAAGKLKINRKGCWNTKERYAASGTSPGSGGPFGAALVTGGRLSYGS